MPLLQNSSPVLYSRIDSTCAVHWVMSADKECLHMISNHASDPCTQARNIDEVMAAHDKYLNGIVAACMLDDHTLGLRTALDAIFACCHRVLPLLRECDAQVTAKSSLLQQVCVTIMLDFFYLLPRKLTQQIRIVTSNHRSTSLSLSQIEQNVPKPPTNKSNFSNKTVFMHDRYSSEHTKYW